MKLIMNNRRFFFLNFTLIFFVVASFILLINVLKTKKKVEYFEGFLKSEKTSLDLIQNHEYDINWNEILKGKSFDDSIILIKTIKFIMNDVAEYDKDLIEFVGSLIKRPSKKSLNLTKPNQEDYSQIGQPIYINSQILKGRKNGFFIESGAHDGEFLSNTLYFEKKFNWTGLLIEPISDSFNQLMAKNRNVFALNACIAKKKPFIAKFRSANVFSGREELLDSKHWDHISNNVVKKVINEYVPCFSLNTILAAINVTDIDFFSLDIEGGECDVIKSIDYSKFNIELFCIEWSALPQSKQNIRNHLVKKGYKLVSENEIDFYFHKII